MPESTALSVNASSAVERAMKDPKTRPHAERIKAAPNPHHAAVEQALKDVAEVAHPRGNPIVFKEIAERHARAVSGAEAKIVRTYKTVEDQNAAVDLVTAQVVRNVTEEIRPPDVQIQSTPERNMPELPTVVAAPPTLPQDAAPPESSGGGGIMIPLAILAALFGGAK